MQKIIVTLFAIAGSLGLFAEGLDPSPHLSGANFQNENFRVGEEFFTRHDDTNGAPDSAGTPSFWITNDEDDFEGTISSYKNGEEDIKYLDFESNITNPVYRTIKDCYRADSISEATPTNIGKGLFMDTRVKFTPYTVTDVHTPPIGLEGTAIPNGCQDKLVVWLREREVESEENGVTVTNMVTNLVATAAYFESTLNARTIKHYELVLPNDITYSSLVTDFHRLTIKAFKNITTSEEQLDRQAGFVVYLDGDTHREPLEYVDADSQATRGGAGIDGSAVSKLTDTIKNRYYTETKKCLLPCLIPGDGQQSISAVGFSGTGAVSEIYFDDYSTAYPDFVLDPYTFYLAWTDGVTGFEYSTDDGQTWTQLTDLSEHGSTNLSVNPSLKYLKVQNVTYKTDDPRFKPGENVWFDSNGTFYDTNERATAGCFDLDNQASEYTIAAFKRNYKVVIGENEQDFQTLFGNKSEVGGAFKYAIDNAKYGAWLKLGCDVVVEGNIKYITIQGTETLKLDLAGHTLKGSDPQNPTIDVYGTLFVTNSTPELGKVLDPADSQSSFAIAPEEGATITIYDGEFQKIDRDTYLESYAAYIYGGKYLDFVYDEAFYLTDFIASEDIIAVRSEPDLLYYYVGKGATATVTLNNGIDSAVATQYSEELDGGEDATTKTYTVLAGTNFTIEYTAKDHYLFVCGEDTTNVTYNITADTEITAPETHADLVTLTLNYDETKVKPTVKQGEDGDVVNPDPENTKQYQVLKGVDGMITWTTKDIWVFVDDGSTEKVEEYNLSADEEKSAPAVKEGTFTVSFNNNGHGGDAPDDQIIQSGSNATRPTPDPEETGWDFGGWYKEAACQNGWDFDTDVVTAATTLYAKWTQHVYFPQASIEQEWAGREGTAASPFVIRNYDDLVALKEMVAAGQTTAGVYFEQVADITFPAVSETTPAWAGIGQAKGTTAFAGVYNGNGQKILNMTLDGNVEYAALFSHLDTATVSNLEVNIAGVVAENGAEIAVAGIAGYADHGVTLADIKVTGTIGTTENPINDNVSGIMCRTTQDGTQTTTVTRVEFAGTINAKSRSSNRKVAGFCGCPYGAIIFTDCAMSGMVINNTEVTMTNEGGTGGFIAFGAYAGTGIAKCDITFNNCSVTGKVTGNKKDIMGLFYGTNRGEASTIQGVNKVKVSTFETLPVLTADGTKDFNNSYGLADANDNTMIDVVAASATGVIAAGNTVYLLKSGLTPAYQFTDVGTIAFNTNLFEAAAFNVTVDDDVKLALSDSAAAGVVTFTAVKHPYVITFNKDEGVLKSQLDVVYGDVLTADKIPNVSADKEGYTFTGWLPSDPTNATVTGDATYTAQWTINQYEVTYTVDGKDAGSEMVKWRESPANIPAIADKKGYSFTGWSPSDPTNAVITCATNFVTTYAPIQYEISYDYGAGVGPTTSNKEEYVISTEDQTIHLTAPTPAAGYDFTGFSLKVDRGGVTFNDKTNMVIEAGQIDPISVQANYEAITYTITYVNVEGATEVPTPTEFTVNDSITIGNPEKEGYTFNGWTWDTQSTPTKDVTIEKGRTSDITFTANWTINTYPVTFNKNIAAEAEGKVEDWPADTNVTWNTTVNDPDPKPTCEGYRFVGWYTTADCATAFDFENTKITDTTTIYAKWVKTFKVTFTAGDGIESIRVGGDDYTIGTELVKDTNAVVEVTAEVKEGYNEFAGASYTIVCDTNVTLTTTLKTFTVKVPSAEHVTVAVTNGTTEAGTESRDYTFDYGSDVKVVFTAAAGYEFTKNTSTNIVKLVENVEIAAPAVKATEYTITYENVDDVSDGDLNLLPKNFTVEDGVITVRRVGKQGYNFEGWTGGWLEEKKTEFSFNSSEHPGNVTFTANWKINEYKVTFETNIVAEAECNVQNMPAATNVTWNTTVNTPAKTPTCEGYRFDGWFKNAVCTEAFNFTTPITSQTRIYAKWVKTFKVTFNAGTGIESIKVDNAEYASGDVLLKDTNAVVEVTAEVEDGYEPFTSASYTIVCDTNVTLTTTATPVDISVPEADKLPTGVNGLKIYQSSDDGATWTLVEGGKIVVGNQWKVEGTVADGYAVKNPIASGTAELGQAISVTEAQVKSAVTYTVKVPALENFTVEVKSNETAVGTQSGDYKFGYGTKVEVVFAPVTGYQITTDTSTNIASLVENVEIAAPTVEKLKYTVTFMSDGAEYAVSNNVPHFTEFAKVKPADPEKVGFGFTGWTPATELTIVSNTTYTAAYTNLEYVLTLTGGANVATNVNPAEATYHYDDTVTITATPNQHYTFEGVALGAGWGLNESGAATNKVTIAGDTEVAIPNAVPAPVEISVPATAELPTGVAGLKIYQKAPNGANWAEVTDGRIVVGNQWKVEGTSATGYTVQNPIATGTAVLGTAIKVEKSDVEAKVTINTYTVTVPELVNFTVAVTNGETEVGTTNGVYKFDYNSNVKVVFAAATGYEITADTSTNIASLVENVVIAAPTVEKIKFDITFTDAAAWTNVVATEYGAVPVAPEAPVVTGKSFKGWDKEVVAAFVEATYTAVYTNNQYTLTIPVVEHASAIVSNDTSEVSERVFDYGTKVTVYWTAEAGWKITSRATELIEMTGDKTAATPTVEKAEITVTVKKGGGIESVTYNEKALEFNDNVATLSLPADATKVTLTLAAVSTIKIPVFTYAKGVDVLGWNTTSKETSYDVTADDTLNFAAEEANAQDPAITDEVAAEAVTEAATTEEGKAKVEALTTGEGAVGGKTLANWINTKADGNVDAALAGNYVKASVKLDVAPITASTAVKVETVEKQTSDLAVTVKVAGVDATKEQIVSFVELCDDLGAANDWEKLPESTLKSAVKIEAGKLVITPQSGISKLFLKVVIPADAN